MALCLVIRDLFLSNLVNLENFVMISLIRGMSCVKGGFICTLFNVAPNMWHNPIYCSQQISTDLICLLKPDEQTLQVPQKYLFALYFLYKRYISTGPDKVSSNILFIFLYMYDYGDKSNKF